MSCLSLIQEVQALTCSKNGTRVYYINGILSENIQSELDQLEKITTKLEAIKNKIDDSGKTYYELIHNPSHNILNDIAELYGQDHFARTGDLNGYSDFLQNVYSRIKKASKPKLKYFFNRGYYATLSRKAKRLRAQKFLNKGEIIAKSSDELIKISEKLVGDVRKTFEQSIIKKEKSIYIAHSQGNTALKEAIIRASSSYDQERHLKKFSGVYHLASPVKNLSDNFTNVRSTLYSNDWIVNIANHVYPELQKSSPTHVLGHYGNGMQSSTEFDEFNHSLSSYISENVFDSNGKSMDIVFKANVTGIADELANNCEPKISVTDVQCHVFPDGKTYSRFDFKFKTEDDSRNLKLATAINSDTPDEPVLSNSYWSEGSHVNVKLVDENGIESNEVSILNPCPKLQEVSAKVFCRGDTAVAEITSYSSSKDANSYALQKFPNGDYSDFAYGPGNGTWQVSNLDIWNEYYQGTVKFYVGVASFDQDNQKMKIAGPYDIPKCD